MAPANILELLWREGLTVSLLDGGKLLVSPSARLRDAHRELLLVNKPAILEFLRESNDVASVQMAALLEAAMRVCDRHDDGPEARADMRADCLTTPPHLLPDLLDYLRGEA